MTRLWKVKVRCGYEQKSSKGQTKEKVKRMCVLVEANTSSDAMAAGEAWANDHLPIGPRWLSVESMEAAAVALPYSLTDAS